MRGGEARSPCGEIPFFGLALLPPFLAEPFRSNASLEGVRVSGRVCGRVWGRVWGRGRLACEARGRVWGRGKLACAASMRGVTPSARAVLAETPGRYWGRYRGDRGRFRGDRGEMQGR